METGEQVLDEDSSEGGSGRMGRIILESKEKTIMKTNSKPVVLTAIGRPAFTRPHTKKPHFPIAECIECGFQEQG